MAIKFIVIYLIIIVLFISLSRNILHLALNYNNTIDKRRKDQLVFKNRPTLVESKQNSKIAVLSERIFETIDIPEANRTKMTNKLLLADWNMTPEDYYTASILSVILGIILGVLTGLITGKPIAGIVIFILCSGLIHFLLNNEIGNRKFAILSEFPSFIQMTEGALVSGLPLVAAIEKTLPYLGDTWKPIVKMFLIASESKPVDECIKYIKELVPIFEIQEFWSLVQLAYEQGIDVQECFEGQKEKIKQIQREIIMSKINKRRLMATMVQFPLLLCMLIGFGLPTASSIMTMM